jgi:hypothetical protein
MHEQLTSRQEARRKQLRFRKDPAAYLAALEDILLKTGLPTEKKPLSFNIIRSPPV